MKLKKDARIYVEINVLQTLDINKSDMKASNSAIYGGEERYMLRDQSWDRATKAMFKDLFKKAELGKRMGIAVSMIATKISELTGENDEMKLQEKAQKALNFAGINAEEGETDALLFMSEAQAEALAQVAVKNETDEKIYTKAFLEQPSVDMAVFGGNVAGYPSLHFEGASQIMYCFSTHKPDNVYNKKINPVTVYRYASIFAHLLAEDLGMETGDAVKKFAEAFILSMPKGKKNAYTNCTVPDMVYITIKSSQPATFEKAFVHPVKATTNGYAEPSKEAFVEYAQETYKHYISKPEKAYVCGQGDCLDVLGEKFTLPSMLDQLEQDLNDILREKEL